MNVNDEVGDAQPGFKAMVAPIRLFGKVLQETLKSVTTPALSTTSVLTQHADPPSVSPRPRKTGEVFPDKGAVPRGRTMAKKRDAQLLFDAVKRGEVGLVQELIAEGISVDSRDSKEKTPLITAAEDGNVDVVQTLLDAGADVNTVDVYGETALMAAAYHDQLNVVEFLVARGADLGVRNNEGSTALELAQEMEHAAVATFLAAQDAKLGEPTSSKSPEDPDDDHDPHSPGAASNSPEGNNATLDTETFSVVTGDGDEETAGAASGSGDQDDATTAHSEPQSDPEPTDGASTPQMSSPEQATRADKGEAGEPGPEMSEGAFTGREKAHSPEAFVRTSTGPITWIQPQVFPSIDMSNENLPELTPSEIALSVESMLGQTLEYGFEQVSRYLYVYVFKCDRHQAFSKKPNKGKRSLAEVARHLDGRVSRQWLADGVRAVAFEEEAQAQGIDLSSFSFSHKVALAKLKDPTQMLSVAKEAVEKRYTVQQIKERVLEVNTGLSSADKALGKVVMRQVGDLVRFSTDKETLAFLRNKERLAAALKKADRLKLLGHIEDANQDVENLRDLLRELEDSLVEITVSQKRSGTSASTVDSGPGGDVSGE